MALDFSAKPYFDDYTKEKGFHKILFKPGVSVQAREMNQMQEILQQQIARLGSHVFKNGSVVIPGQSKLNLDAKYVILNNVDNDPELLTKLKGKKLLQNVESSNLEATVLLTQPLGDLVLAIIVYTNSTTKTVAGDVVNVTRFSSDFPITVEDEPSISISVATKGPNNEYNTGPAILLAVESGVFYVDGYFVHTESQTTLVSWNYTYYNLNVKSGFIIKKEVLTAYDDASLFDNATGAPNEGAPGADRLQITLQLSTLPLEDNETDFLEIVRIEKGSVRISKQYSQYNVLEDTFARRTYDESGDYAVHGLNIRVTEHLKDENNPSGFRTASQGGNSNLMAVEISEGKAYVKGYEVTNPSNLYLEVNKARTPDAVKVTNNVIQVNDNGEYILLAPGNEFIDLSRHPIIWLTNGEENTSSIIGYCIPKHLEAINISGQTIIKLFGSFFLSQSSTYGWQHLGGWKLNDLKNGPVLQKIFLDNVISNFNVTDGISLTSHIGYTPYAWDSANKVLYVKKAQSAPVFNTNTQVVKGSASGYVSKIEFRNEFPEGSGDLIKLKISNIKTIKDVLGNSELTADMGFTTTIITDVNGYGVYDYTGDGVFTGQPVAAHTGIDNAYFSNIVSIENEGKRLVINNSAYPNALFSVSASLNKTVSVKTKTLAEGSTTINIPSSRSMALAHKDVYRLKHVYVSPDLMTPATTSDTDIAEYYELVNNDTLDFYQNTLLKAKAGFGVPAGRLLVVYDYFLHSPGEVFTVDSYTSLRDNPTDENDTTHIGRIPTFSTKEKTYILSDYLDFRQVPRPGFFILKANVTSGSPNIYLENDYSSVIESGSVIFCNGFDAGTTVQSIDSQKIVASNNSTYTGSVYVVINANTAVSAAEPFHPEERNIWSPMSGQPIIYDASYFVDRWDRVVYYKTGEIKYIYGIPGITRYPEVPIDAMSLATLIVPAYTRQAAFVNYKKDDNRRYTMRDIGKLERRIENLEYYTTLTLKELETKNLKITDTNGLDRFKAGFFVSDFHDFGVFDPFDGGFQATLVPEKGYVIPLEYSDSIDLVLNQNISSNFVIKDNKVFMPYTEVVEIEQPFATATETINPYLVIRWFTSMDLDPSEDTWIETEWAPTITNVTNITKNITSINGSFNPRTYFSAAELASLQDLGLDKNGKRHLLTTITNKSTRLLGTSVIPFMRSKTIRFNIKGSKPSTRYWASFDSVDVSDFCRPVNIETQVVGEWGEPLVSDAMGNLLGDFQISPGRFATGTKTFKIADINLVEFPDAGVECEASATYTANGTLRTMQEVIDITNTTTIVTNIYVPPPPPPKPPAPPPNVPPPPAPADIQPWWHRLPPPAPSNNCDPLAQSFFVNNISATGMFITKIDLYFWKKDPIIPVLLELREMKNGYPVNERIPGSLVSLSPSQVNVSEDSTVPTSFIFDKPIWIPANKEFCFVVFGNTSRYHVWISRLGEKVVNEDRIVGEQPSLGSLFKSQNASTWTPFQLEDIKFKIYRAKFDTSVSAEWIFENNGIAARRRVKLADFYTTEGSRFITVHHGNHGMEVNGIVNILSEEAVGLTYKSASPTTVFNGIPMSDIYGNQIVKEIVDINHYKIEVATPATKTGYFEDIGRYVYIDSNINYYRYLFAANEFIPPESDVRYFANLITGKDFDGGQTPKVVMAEQQIKNHDSNRLQEVALVQTSLNETSKSMVIKAAVKTNNDYVAPVLSLKGNSVIVSSLALNKPSPDNEIDPNMGNGKVSSKIVTQKIRLKTNADSLRIFTSENKKESDDIEVYYRTAINRDLDEKTWTKLDPVNVVVSYDTETYIEHERRIDGIPDFDEFQIKIVLKGTNSVRHPSIKELRVIAVAG